MDSIHPEVSKDVDRRCSSIGAQQHGLISRAQALDAGIATHDINYRLRTGKWKSVYPSVYLLRGVPFSVRTRLKAALLYVGEDSAISHRSAVTLLGLGHFPVSPVEISTATRGKQAEGITIHVTSNLPRVDVTKIDGIEVTTVLRTLADLGAVIGPAEVEDCLDEALRRRLTSVQQLHRHLDRLSGSGRRGAGALRKLVKERGPGFIPTESRLEARLFRILKKAQLPIPAKQVEVVECGAFLGRVDFAYPDARVALEADSYTYHSLRRDWEADKRRRALLVSHGWRVLETTWRGMVDNPQGLIDNVARALGHSRLFSGHGPSQQA